MLSPGAGTLDLPLLIPATVATEVCMMLERRRGTYAEVLTLTGDSYRTRQRRELLAKENRSSNN